VVKPHDEWNKTRIVVSGNRVEHWLNGARWSPMSSRAREWKTKVTASKFNDYKGYAWPRGPDRHPGRPRRHSRDPARAIRELP